MRTLLGHVALSAQRQPSTPSTRATNGIESSFDAAFECPSGESTAASGGGDTRDTILALANLTSQIGVVLEGLARGKIIKDDSVAANLNTMLSTFRSFTAFYGEERAKGSGWSCHSEILFARNDAISPRAGEGSPRSVDFARNDAVSPRAGEARSVDTRRGHLSFISEVPNARYDPDDDSVYSVMLQILSQRQALRTQRPRWGERTLTDVVRECSTFARVALFCGGHARFVKRHTEAMYKGIFVSSFISCFLVCMANMFVRTPPYNYVWLDVLTVYLHVVGFHSWQHWRHHGNDPVLTKFVQDMEASTDSMTKSALRVLALQTHVCCGILLLVQILLVGVAFLALCQPAFEHWQSGSGDSGSRMFSLFHALLMWSVVPQHVPTIVTGHVLFLYVIRLHTVDFMRALSLVDRIEKERKSQVLSRPSTSQEWNAGSAQLGFFVQDKSIAAATMIDKITIIAEIAQDRLDSSCRKFSCLWIHQLAYAFCQILAVAAFCSPVLSLETRAQTIKDIQATSRFGLFLPIFHGAAGVSVLLTTLIGPAMTTNHYMLAPPAFLKAMRKLGASVTQTETRIAFLDMRLLGFNYNLQTIDMTWVSKFISFVVLGISFAAWSKMF